MRYVEVPNIPQSKVSVAVIDGRASSEVEDLLVQSGIELLKTTAHPDVYEAISFHPDIMLHHLGGKDIIYAPGTSSKLLSTLEKKGFSLIRGETALADRYPRDIAYNVARVGGFAFHNFKYTDAVLLKELEKRGIELINVKQGYAKCSVSVVDNNSIITSDRGIARSAEKHNLDVLLIETGPEIVLKGMNHGFIGGCTGLLSPDTWFITGDPFSLQAFHKIKEFLDSKAINVIGIPKKTINDLGSILPLCE